MCKNQIIYTAGRNPAVAKYSIIFNYNFKICSFPFSAFTISHFLVDHQLGLPTRVCTNWSGQVDFGPHSLDPIHSTHLYNHWLPTKNPQHSIQETSSKYFNIYSTLGDPIKLSITYCIYSGMFWWILFHGINPNFPQLSLRFSTLETH